MSETSEQMSPKPLYSEVLFTPCATSTDIDDQVSTAGSVQSEDNQAIATVSNADDAHTESVQVSSRKLQKMIKMIERGATGAETFFQNIMQTTETYITWPRQVDAKNKIYAYVQIRGKPNDVAWAKGIITNQIGIKGPPLKLKIVISNTDHIYAIGRENYNLNDIMDQTDTRINFPDANQKNVLRKGNLVSIFGSLVCLDEARILLRLSTPLLLCFDLPIGQRPPYVKNVQSKFKVQVIVSSGPKNLSVSIKGPSKRTDMVKEAARTLINSICGQQAAKTLVSLQMDIAPQYQETVKGGDNENLTTIMESTKTKIFFPDLSMRGNVKQRSQVTITGSIDEVCIAKDELEGYLPAELTFDIPGEYQCKATEILNLGTKFGVCITLSQKELHSTIAVTVKTKEKFVEKIYEVYRDIMQLRTEETVEEEVPKAFHLLEGAYQKVMDNLVNNYVENIVERADATIFNKNPVQVMRNGGDSDYLRVAQTNNVLEQFCAAYIDQGQLQAGPTYTPDSGHSSGTVHQGELYSNDWMPTGSNRLEAFQQMSLGAVETAPKSSTYCNPNFAFDEEAYRMQYLDLWQQYAYEYNQSLAASAAFVPPSPLFVDTPLERAENNIGLQSRFLFP